MTGAGTDTSGYRRRPLLPPEHRGHRNRSRRRAPRTAAIGVGLFGIAAMASACATPTKTSSAANDVVARVGNLEIIHPFLPDPASPSVAAIYLMVRDVGAVPDELLSVSTPITRTTMLMTEDERGRAGVMARIEDLPIPAHGQASLAPGDDHVMLENISSPFKVGQEVPVTLHFAHAGALSFDVPVVPLLDILGSGSTAMNHMSGMP